MSDEMTKNTRVNDTLDTYDEIRSMRKQISTVILSSLNTVIVLAQHNRYFPLIPETPFLPKIYSNASTLYSSI